MENSSLETMTSGGYLRHTCKDGRSSIEGFLEDYAQVIEGLLQLHQATFSGKWLREALRLAEIMVEEFWDESSGLFYDTGKRHPELFKRPRNIHDGAISLRSFGSHHGPLKSIPADRHRATGADCA